MALKEYHKIDMKTGVRLDVCLLDDKYEDREGNIIKVPIPEDCKEGWQQPFFNPIWDFEKECWVESALLSEVIGPIREQKINQLHDECQAYIMSGFFHGEDFFGFHDTDQTNFNQQLSLLLLDPTQDTVYWKTENNGIKIFTREQFIEICRAGESHKRSNINHYWLLKHYVETHEFSTLEELTSIDFSFNPNS